jgi:hypothetical protein
VASLTKTSFIRNLTALSAVVVISACGDAGATSPASKTSNPAITAIPVVTVAPGAVTVNVGDTTKFSAVVKDASGVVRSDVAPTWRIDNASVATLRTDGTVIAVATGTTAVTATALGRSTRVPVTVVAPGVPTPPPAPPTSTPTPAPTPTPTPTPPPAAPAPPSSSEPTYTSGVHAPLWMDDFENVANTAAIYARYATQGSENGLHLDGSAGLNGSKGMRLDWASKSGCSDDSHFVEGSFPSAPKEVVVSYSVRYQPGFVFDWIGRNGACSGNAKKLFFLWAGTGSRFDFISENHVLGMGSDHDHPLHSQNVGGSALRPEDLADGAWHRITIRVKQSSTPDATDGYIHAWVDGVQKWKRDNIASHASGGWTLFKFPTTFNQGSPVNQSEWVDNIRVWTP